MRRPSRRPPPCISSCTVIPCPPPPSPPLPPAQPPRRQSDPGGDASGLQAPPPLPLPWPPRLHTLPWPPTPSAHRRTNCAGPTRASDPSMHPINLRPCAALFSAAKKKGANGPRRPARQKNGYTGERTCRGGRASGQAGGQQEISGCRLNQAFGAHRPCAGIETERAGRCTFALLARGPMACSAKVHSLHDITRGRCLSRLGSLSAMRVPQSAPPLCGTHPRSCAHKDIPGTVDHGRPKRAAIRAAAAVASCMMFASTECCM